MDRKRRGRARISAALLALLLALSALPVFAEGEPVGDVTITPLEAALKEGRKLTEIGFTAKDGDTVLTGGFAWDAGTPYNRTLTVADSGKYKVVFTPDPAVQNGKSYVVTTAEVEVTVTASGYTTASAIADAVRGISSMTAAEVDELAAAMRALSDREKGRLSRSTIEKLDAAYCSNHGLTHETAVEIHDDGVSGNRIPRGSYAYGVAAATGGNAPVDIYQQKPSGSSVLQFELEVGGGDTRLDAPIVVYVALPNNISSSRDYYLKGPGGEVSVSVSRDYLAFAASEPGRFRLYRESSSSRDNDDDDDDDSYYRRYRSRDRDRDRDYEVTPFWEAVIDAVRNAKDGDRMRVSVGSRTQVPADLLRELKGRPVMLVLRPDRQGDSVTIRGERIGTIPAARDYYTMNNLLSIFEPGDKFEEAEPVSSAPPPAPAQPAPSVPAPGVPAVVPSVPAVPSAPEVSSGMPEPSAPEELPDIEVEAEEDDPPASSEEEKPGEPTGGEEDPGRLAVFAAGVVAAAALLACALTLTIWAVRRRRD